MKQIALLWPQISFLLAVIRDLVMIQSQTTAGVGLPFSIESTYQLCGDQSPSSFLALELLTSVEGFRIPVLLHDLVQSFPDGKQSCPVLRLAPLFSFMPTFLFNLELTELILKATKWDFCAFWSSCEATTGWCNIIYFFFHSLFVPPSVTSKRQGWNDDISPTVWWHKNPLCVAILGKHFS